MGFVTETVIIRIHPGADPTVVGSPAALKFKEACQTLSQQKGFLRQYWGLKLEDPETIVWTIDWETMQYHQDFANSEEYKTFTSGIGEVIDFKTILMYHTEYTAETIEARETPVTEFCYFTLPADADNEQKSALEDAFLNLVKFCKGKCPNLAYSVGWIIESMNNPASPDGKVKAFSGMLGWNSKEEHMSMREEPEFPEFGKVVRGLALQGTPELSMFHVALRGKKL